MASVKPILRVDKVGANGEAPIYLRLIKNRKPSYKSTGLRLNPKHWNEQSAQVKPNHPNSTLYNNRIAKLMSDTTGAVIQLEDKNPSIDSSAIIDHLSGKDKPTFLKYCELILNRSKHKCAVGTIDKNKSIIAKLRSYLNGKDIRIEDVNTRWLNDYELHLREHHGNGTNTIKTSMKFIGQILRQATNEELIEHHRNPINTGRYRIKSEKTNIEYLTDDELARMEGLEVTAGTRMEQHKNLFVFACYGAGIRVSDLLTMKWDAFDGERIKLVTRKTTTPINIKLPVKALTILESQPNFHSRIGFVFNLLDANLNMKDPRAVDTAITNATAYINKNLKFLAAKAGINKNLHFHMSRHTWATKAVRLMGIEVVSKLLGHGSLRTTMIYAKLADEDLDKAMERFNE